MEQRAPEWLIGRQLGTAHPGNTSLWAWRDAEHGWHSRKSTNITTTALRFPKRWLQARQVNGGAVIG
ncbi:hypothetical protein A5711_21610 [Mycobacterium sp. E2238]|nr:hypothetical protein A5711_21610 [Mycobacterium sp. E2238]